MTLVSTFEKVVCVQLNQDVHEDIKNRCEKTINVLFKLYTAVAV